MLSETEYKNVDQNGIRVFYFSSARSTISTIAMQKPIKNKTKISHSEGEQTDTAQSVSTLSRTGIQFVYVDMFYEQRKVGMVKTDISDTIH